MSRCSYPLHRVHEVLIDGLVSDVAEEVGVLPEVPERDGPAMGGRAEELEPEPALELGSQVVARTGAVVAPLRERALVDAQARRRVGEGVSGHVAEEGELVGAHGVGRTADLIRDGAVDPVDLALLGDGRAVGLLCEVKLGDAPDPACGGVGGFVDDHRGDLFLALCVGPGTIDRREDVFGILDFFLSLR